MAYLYIGDAAVLRIITTVTILLSFCMLYALLVGLVRLKELTERLFESLHHKLNRIMDNEARAEQDISTILAVVTQEAQTTVAIGQELTDLRAQLASAGEPSDALVAKLDDLANRATAAGANLQALVPAPAGSGTPVAGQ